MYPKCPIDKILVQIDTKFQEEKITASGFKYYQDASYNPEWNVTVTGKVISVPSVLRNAIDGDLSERRHSDIVPEVQVGDELFFSYQVITDRELRNDSDAFKEITEGDGSIKVFENGKKEMIKTRRLTKKEAIGVLVDKNNDVLDGFQGTPKQVEKWMLQYPIAGDSDTYYKNCIPLDDAEYWMVDYFDAIAVKREDRIIMIGGNVLMEPQESRMVYEKQVNQELHLVTKVDEGKAKVISIGSPLKNESDIGVKDGDYIRFDPKYAQKYELWAKNYLLILQSQVLGIENDT